MKTMDELGDNAGAVAPAVSNIVKTMFEDLNTLESNEAIALHDILTDRITEKSYNGISGKLRTSLIQGISSSRPKSCH